MSLRNIRKPRKKELFFHFYVLIFVYFVGFVGRNSYLELTLFNLFPVASPAAGFFGIGQIFVAGFEQET